jgi:hypothetical protein
VEIRNKVLDKIDDLMASGKEGAFREYYKGIKQK